MGQVMLFVEVSQQSVTGLTQIVKRCTKPDRKDCQKIAMATAVGFATVGFTGFFV